MNYSNLSSCLSDSALLLFWEKGRIFYLSFPANHNLLEPSK